MNSSSATDIAQQKNSKKLFLVTRKKTESRGGGGGELNINDIDNDWSNFLMGREHNSGEFEDDKTQNDNANSYKSNMEMDRNNYSTHTDNDDTIEHNEYHNEH